MFVLIASAAFLGLLILLILLRGRLRLEPVSFTLALTAAAAGCLLAAVGLRQGPVFCRYASPPEATAEAFFDAVLAGREEDACSLLGNYDGLGLRNTADDPAAAALYEALRESYSYRLLGDAETQGLSAVQRVAFRTLDIPSMQEELRAETLSCLAKLVDERPYGEIYDEQDRYRPAITDEAYRGAVDAVLAHRADFERSETLTVTLRYDESGWHVLADAALFSALSGYLL